MAIRAFICWTFSHKPSESIVYEQYDTRTGELLIREHFCLRCKKWV